MEEKWNDVSKATEKRKSKRIHSVKKKLPIVEIAKIIREVYDSDPGLILEISPELFKLVAEFEENKHKYKSRYFDNYVTERELSDLLEQTYKIKDDIGEDKDKAIRFLELISTIGIQDYPDLRPAVLKASKTVGLDINDEKDTSRVIKRGQIANRIELIRGFMLSVDWAGKILELSLIGKDVKIRNAGQSLIGCLSLKGLREYDNEVLTLVDIDKTVIIEKSALISIIDKESPKHREISQLWLRLIDNRCNIVCHYESILSLCLTISEMVGAQESEVIYNYAMGTLKIVLSLSRINKDILRYAVNEHFRGLDSQAIYGILLAKMSKVPMLTTSKRVENAFKSFNENLTNPISESK